MNEEDAFMWLLFGIACISGAIGYLVEPGYGWLAFGCGVICLVLFVSWQK